MFSREWMERRICFSIRDYIVFVELLREGIEKETNEGYPLSTWHAKTDEIGVIDRQLLELMTNWWCTLGSIINIGEREGKRRGERERERGELKGKKAEREKERERGASAMNKHHKLLVEITRAIFNFSIDTFHQLELVNDPWLSLSGFNCRPKSN